MIPVGFYQNNIPIINFTTDDMTSKFEFFKENNNNIYLTGSKQRYWLQMLDGYWYEKDITYSDYYDFWTD